jgi:hypothetical protein
MESPTTPLREPLLPQALHTPQGIRFIVPGSLSEPYAARTTSEEDSSSFSDAPIWTWANAPLLLGSLALAFFTANLGARLSHPHWDSHSQSASALTRKHLRGNPTAPRCSQPHAPVHSFMVQCVREFGH